MKSFWFGVFSVAVGFAYVTAITFLHIPESGKQTANIALGFIMGTMLKDIYAYLYGGSPANALKKTHSQPAGTTEITADITATTTTPDEKDK